MPFLELFDETLDINSTENYELSLQVSFDEISFSILDTLRNKFVLLRSYEPDENSFFNADKLIDIIRKDDFLSRRFKKTNLITPSPKSTLVPASLFYESRQRDYLAFNHTTGNDSAIFNNKLAEHDLFIIFSLSVSLVELLNEFFPGKIFLHQLKPFIQFINLNRRMISNNDIFINFEKGYFDLIIVDQNNLRFCNTFHYQFMTDIQYFVLYVLKKMNIGQDEPVFLSGKILKNKEILNNFSRYQSTIKYSEPADIHTYSYVFSDTDLHRFLNLFNSVHCE